ncbi:MAG: FKBP-type peptidyl-prolyl cis-trans isomerase [Chitinophagaceae bacterium]
MRFGVVFLSILFAVSSFAQKRPIAPKPKFAGNPSRSIPKPSQKILYTLTDSASYAIGVNIAKNLQSQGFSGIDALKLYKGMSDILLGKTPQLTESQAANCINNYQQKHVSTPKPANQKNSNSNTNTAATIQKQNVNNTINEAAKNKVLGREFLEQNAKKPGVISMPGGWQYQVLKNSLDTTHPKFEDKVTFHYTVSDITGKLIQSSKENNQPITYPVGNLIMGWQVALPMMTVGSSWRIYLPSTLAYGDTGAGDDIRPGMTLIFDIEVLSVNR